MAVRHSLKLRNSSPPPLLKRIRTSPMWGRAKCKIEIAADFYDAYVCRAGVDDVQYIGREFYNVHNITTIIIY